MAYIVLNFTINEVNAPFTLQVVSPVVTGDSRWRNHLPSHPIFLMVFGAMVHLLPCYGGSHGLFTVTQVFLKVSLCFDSL